MRSVEKIQEEAGSCYGCMYWPGSSEERCDENKNWRAISKKNSPICYEECAGVLIRYNTKDEFDNVETEYSSPKRQT